MKVKQAILTSEELLSSWKEAARARRLSLSAWIRSAVAEYIELPRDLPPEEVPTRQALWIDFWWDEDDRVRCHRFARDQGYSSLSELLRRILAGASAKVLDRQREMSVSRE